MQCYKDRAPKWIKLDRELLDDYNFDSLSDATKFHVLGIRLLAAKLDNKIPRDEEWIRYKISAKDPIDLDAIQAAGFIEPYDGSESLVQICTDMYKDVPREEKRKVEKSKTETGFQEWYKVYPNKKKPMDAEKAWKQTKDKHPPLKDMLAVLEQQKTSAGWTKDGGQFIPYPATYLRAGQWDDEPDAPSTPQAKAKGLIPFTTCHKCGAGADVRVGDHSTPYCRGCRPEAFKTQFPGIDL